MYFLEWFLGDLLVHFRDEAVSIIDDHSHGSTTELCYSIS